MLKVLIVDDEANAREAISQMVTIFCPKVELIGALGSVKEAIEVIKAETPDILLLDIEVGKESGFDILKHFPKPTFKIIFVTAYQQYAIEAFRFAALDYLLKPVDPDLLMSAITKASDTIDLEKISVKIDSFMHNVTHNPKNAKKIVLKTSGDIYVVNVSDIMYCEADFSYTTFYLNDKSRIVVSSTLGHYEEMLTEMGFFRIHKSYLLNMVYLKRYEKKEGGNVILNDNTCLPLASRKKEQFLQQLANL